MVGDKILRMRMDPRVVELDLEVVSSSPRHIHSTIADRTTAYEETLLIAIVASGGPPWDVEEIVLPAFQEIE